jgi:hypothetical protein
MLKQILFSLMIGSAAVAGAQTNPFLNDANGRPIITNANNYVADGSPYLFDEYYPAEITFQNGKIYKDVKTKINVNEGQLLFMDDQGNEFMAAAPVKAVKMLKSGTEIRLESPGGSINSNKTPLVQILSDKKAILTKQIAINYTEARKYGEGSMTRTYKKVETYWGTLPGEAPKKIEKNKGAVAAFFGPKQTEILSFIDQNKFKFKSDDDFIKVFDYYSTLN